MHLLALAVPTAFFAVALAHPTFLWGGAFRLASFVFFWLLVWTALKGSEGNRYKARFGVALAFFYMLFLCLWYPYFRLADSPPYIQMAYEYLHAGQGENDRFVNFRLIAESGIVISAGSVGFFLGGVLRQIKGREAG